MNDELTADEVLKVARLAKLSVPEGAMEAERARLGAMLEYVRAVASVNVEGVEPMTRVTEEENRFGSGEPEADEPTARAVEEGMFPDAYEVPDDEGGSVRYLKVPRVLGEGGGA